MTANRNFKRRVRARAARTGESYTAALRHFRPAPMGEVMPESTRPESTTSESPQPESAPLRLAVAQCRVRGNPGDRAALRAGGEEVRHLMRAAHRAGARLVLFPEGAFCSPHKLALSTAGPGQVGPADWSRCAWDVLHAELAQTARLAGELRLWTVVGSVHPLTPPHRPHNSLYVFSDRGEPVTRYDERMLSETKVSHMYTPGAEPVTFTAAGVRFGCLLGMEVHYPELFTAYERLDVDCVLFATAGGAPGNFAVEARGHAAANSYWAGFAALAGPGAGPAAPSGVIAPDGTWAARCPAADGPAGSEPAVAVADLDDSADSAATAVRLARPWRRAARGGRYTAHLVADPRSADRTVL